MAYGGVHDNGILGLMAGHPWLRTSWLPFPQLKLMHFLMIRKHAMVIELGPSSRVVRSLHDPSGLITTSVSSVLDLGDKLPWAPTLPLTL